MNSIIFLNFQTYLFNFAFAVTFLVLLTNYLVRMRLEGQNAHIWIFCYTDITIFVGVRMLPPCKTTGVAVFLNSYLLFSLNFMHPPVCAAECAPAIPWQVHISTDQAQNTTSIYIVN